MAIRADDDLNLSPSGTRQSSSLMGMTPTSSLESLGRFFTDGLDSNDTNDDTVDVLNGLLESCRYGVYGFGESAEHTQAPVIKTVLYQRAGDCQTAAGELQQLIAQMRGEAGEGGTAGEALHRGRVAVKGISCGYSSHDMLEECERAKDVSVAQHRKFLKQDLPFRARTMMVREARGAQLTTIKLNYCVRFTRSSADQRSLL